MNLNGFNFVIWRRKIVQVVALLILVPFHAATHNFEAVQELAQDQKSLVPVLVIGSGVAGLSAAIYTARARIHTLVMSGNEPGGQLMGSSLVENMPGVVATAGYKVVNAIEAQARAAGAQVLDDAVQHIAVSADGTYFIVTTAQGDILHALTIIITTGSSPRMLAVTDEDLYTNHGVYTCAVCDCRQASGQHVVVVGGGDSAIEAVMHVAPYAQDITLVVRGSALRASKVMQEKLAQYTHVTILYDHAVAQFNGASEEDGPALNECIVKHTQSGTEMAIPCRCAFIEIGHIPNSQAVADIIALDAQNYILLEGRSQKTSCTGIFAAGDVTDPHYKQAAKASGDAVAAALEAISYLHAQGFSPEVAQELSSCYFENVQA